MTTGPERKACPACEAFSTEVGQALEDGTACPACGLPANAFPLVAEARSRTYRQHIIDALIEYARLAETLDRQHGEDVADLAAARAAARRADERSASVRAEIEQMRGAQAATRARYQREIAGLNWRLTQVRELIFAPLNGPLPEHLREDARVPEEVARARR